MKPVKSPIESVINKSSVNAQIVPRITLATHSVEFFHIYTDETINFRHDTGIEYLRALEKAWDFKYKRIVMIDNYNPRSNVLTPESVLQHLDEKGMSTDFWALEGDLVPNAKKLLMALTSNKLKKNYEQYIMNHNKYPCSLLTAAWYLTRLGRFSSDGIIKSTSEIQTFVPAERLLNILPQDYKAVESRARELIQKSVFSEDIERIQDLFYPIDSGRELDLF